MHNIIAGVNQRQGAKSPMSSGFVKSPSNPKLRTRWHSASRENKIKRFFYFFHKSSPTKGILDLGKMGAENSIYDPNRVVPLLVPEAAARRMGSSSRLVGPTRHPMGSQD